MLETAAGVSGQVLTLFLLIGVGVICDRAKILSHATVRQMTNFLLFFVTPSVIIHALQMNFDRERAMGLLIAALLAVLAHIVGILLSSAFFRRSSPDQKPVLRFGIVYSNAGFMALPLTAAIAGTDGVFYGGVFVIVFNLFCWTHGVIIMSGGKKNMSLKKALINPGTIGFAVGLPFFLFSIPMPQIPMAALTHMASLNSPLAMIVIGTHLSRTNIRTAFADTRIYAAVALRLLIVPSLIFAAMFALNRFTALSETLVAALIIPACAPAAANATLFSDKFNRDTALASKVMVVTTLFSVVTMPLFVSAAIKLI